MLFKVQTTYTSLELQNYALQKQIGHPESVILTPIAGQYNAHVAFLTQNENYICNYSFKK